MAFVANKRKVLWWGLGWPVLGSIVAPSLTGGGIYQTAGGRTPDPPTKWQ